MAALHTAFPVHQGQKAVLQRAPLAQMEVSLSRLQAISFWVAQLTQPPGPNYNQMQSCFLSVHTSLTTSVALSNPGVFKKILLEG